MATLPPADVEVTPAISRDPSATHTAQDIVISRKGSDGVARARSYRVDGNSTSEILAEGLRRVLADPRTHEAITRE